MLSELFTLIGFAFLSKSFLMVLRKLLSVAMETLSKTRPTLFTGF